MLQINRVLVPFDFSDDAVLALKHAKELATLYNAKLDALHVLEVIATPTIDEEGCVTLRTDDDPSVLEPARILLEQRLKELGINADAHVARGSTVEEVKQFTKENETDLVVIASHGLTGIRARLLGSVSRAVLEDVSCPVLLLKGHGRSLLEAGT